MSPPTLLLARISLLEMRSHWRFLYARIKQDVNTSGFVAQVAAFEPVWNAAFQRQLTLEDAVTDGEAGAIYCDGQLDAFAGELWTAINGPKNRAGASPVGTLYFGSATLHDFTKPVLGTELKGALAWPGHLSQATLPALTALAPKGTTVVGAADAAAKALAKAIADLDQFKKGGELQAVYDAYNTLATTVHAGLKAFALAHAELKLGNPWLESFFMRLPRSAEPTTASAAAQLVAQLQTKLGEATQLHTELAAEEKAKADAVAAHDKAVADADAKKKAAEQAKKEAADAEKSAAKLKPKKKR